MLKRNIFKSKMKYLVIVIGKVCRNWSVISRIFLIKSFKTKVYKFSTTIKKLKLFKKYCIFIEAESLNLCG